MRRSVLFLIALFATFALFAAACGDDSDDGTSDTESGTEETGAEDPESEDPESEDPESEDTESDGADADPSSTTQPEEEDEELTASARGITEDTIHIGVAVPDVSAFADHGDQNARFQEIADQINAAGGINGRQLELHHARWDLLDTAGFEAACVQLTEDVEVFAVIARVPAQFGEMTCFTELSDHLTINALDLDEAEVDSSNGLLYSVLSDQQQAMLGGLEALASELEGAKVALTTADTTEEAQADEIAARLEELGVEVVDTTIGQVSYTDDPTAALAEQERFAERWKVAGATHVIGIGNGVVGAAYGLQSTGNTDIVLVTANLNERTLDSLGADLTQLEMIGVAAPSFAIVAEAGENGMPECIEKIEAAGLGPVILYPEEEDLTALPSTAGACASFDFLQALLTAAGTNPSQDDVVAILDAGLDFEMTSAASASASTDKAYLNDDSGIIYDWDPATGEFVPRS